MAILTIDAGNTRVKWGLFDAVGHLLKQGASLHTDLKTLQLPIADQVLISNVAGDFVETSLKKLLMHHTNVHWLTSQAEACGVTNGYENPTQLGTDRWAAMIAAWHLYQHSADSTTCIIINAGTAVTIDVVRLSRKLNGFSQAHFVGGVILPGLHLMQQSLLQNTANLDEKSKLPIRNDTAQMIANNTKDAIHLGAMHAICGAIDRIANQHQNHQSETPIILSGGDANTIKNALTDDVTKQAVIVDNLVLQGLYLLSVSQYSVNENNKK